MKITPNIKTISIQMHHNIFINIKMQIIQNKYGLNYILIFWTYSYYIRELLKFDFYFIRNLFLLIIIIKKTDDYLIFSRYNFLIATIKLNLYFS